MQCFYLGYKEPDVASGTCAAYSPMNHLVYCGNRKGELNIYDVRTHKKLHKLTAHESCIKAVALDPDEYYLATGSSEGNIKVFQFFLARLFFIVGSQKLRVFFSFSRYGMWKLWNRCKRITTSTQSHRSYAALARA